MGNQFQNVRRQIKVWSSINFWLFSLLSGNTLGSCVLFLQNNFLRPKPLFLAKELMSKLLEGFMYNGVNMDHGYAWHLFNLCAFENQIKLVKLWKVHQYFNRSSLQLPCRECLFVLPRCANNFHLAHKNSNHLQARSVSRQQQWQEVANPNRFWTSLIIPMNTTLIMYIKWETSSFVINTAEEEL